MSAKAAEIVPRGGLVTMVPDKLIRSWSTGTYGDTGPAAYFGYADPKSAY
jgi:hypothetical protein